ncbi:craniofacial development protein 2-like [Anneissia japonica]|uniref:craniofacial development protein 2-like n=1 Tax=Anneissia japonica TaxID=1529436 RepID=UPI001425A5BF|nr:craniofacial development protein 2-like [Anneissia japonica]
MCKDEWPFISQESGISQSISPLDEMISMRKNDTGDTETPAVDPVNSEKEEDVTTASRSMQNDDSSFNPHGRVLPDDATLKHRGCPLKIGKWNIRIMYQAEKLDNCIGEMKSYETDIMGVAEVKWLDPGQINKDEHVMFFLAEKSHKNGVVVIINKRCTRAVQGY